ncbi:ABC transporter ATP-binding protein [Bacteroidota bacterium]
MKIYLRILSYAKPLSSRLPQYIVFAFLGIFFGLINLTLLKPLFDVIFNQIDPVKLEAYTDPPKWGLSFNYLIHSFYYKFIQFTNEHGKIGSLVYVAIVIIIANFTANFFKYFAQINLAMIRGSAVKNIRQTIFEKVSHLHIGYFSNERRGDIMSRISSDVQQVEMTVTSTLQVFFRDPITILLSFTYLFWRSPNLTIFTLIMVPIAGAIIAGIAKQLKKVARAGMDSLGRIVNNVDEMIGGLRIIKAFNAVNLVNRKFRVETRLYEKYYVSMYKKYELAAPLSEFLGVIFVGFIMLYGGYLVLNDQSSLDASGFVTYVIVFTQVLNPAKAISQAVTIIQRGIASAERIFRVVDTKPDIQNDPDPVFVEDFSENIEFRHVNFAYNTQPVLQDINLKIPKGKTIALVGPSGGGKSTMADLIPRFYDITGGSLTIDQIEVKKIDIESLRGLMGIVSQESILFNDTVFNNIAFGIENPDPEKVERAAKIANAHDFIMQMDNGYTSSIGEGGTKLSGGQRQRLSIARAIMKNPQILILDEATSALDSESETLVQEALDNLMENRTSIVIAHRLSTIQNADEIVVLQEGKIVERGTHNELLVKDGVYKKLSEMQSF